MTDSYQARVEEALAALTQAAGQTFRRAGSGPLIENLGCILAGRKFNWWPDDHGNPPDPKEVSDDSRIEEGYYLMDSRGRWLNAHDPKQTAPTFVDHPNEATRWNTQVVAQTYADSSPLIGLDVYKVKYVVHVTREVVGCHTN